MNGGGSWEPPETILRNSIASLLSAVHTPSAAEIVDFFNLWRILNAWADVPAAL
jgi:hypothetical protein